ncbi:hypothetical protein L6164_003840 [Bauhinia variegata]|uniref:Uncharacterized protein n=1 Tax=Bauhinia variegata TaxID=167791 RepID=A0ACB9Q4S4_BAUVA|nr:hypothetical protein L6164_003840 [Bauhinia variegata]
MAEESKRYAVVTGANKGIGYGICKKLASSGVVVVLTARNEKRDFIKTQFGKLDILVNNAGVAGGIVDHDALIRYRNGEKVDWNEILKQDYEMTEECVRTNYYGAERVIEALLPLLQLSTSPRIVNVSSKMGSLKNVPSERVKTVLSDIESLTKERIDEVIREFLKDYKEGSLESKGWPTRVSGYTVAKAALNAYTRMLANKFPHAKVNCVCPGYVKTDINLNTGILSIDDGAENPAKLALLPDNGPSGLFFSLGEVVPF